MQQQIIIHPEGSELIYEVLVSHDGSTVWINCSDGNSVGRFSKHAGIDLHRTIAEQMAGEGQCLDCTHEPAGAEEWERFRGGLAQHFNVSLPPDLIRFP
ncbi:hypothetical protein ACIOWK_33530 [Pseudomonas protegens]|uniref:hypothetical protein n=1 Tax=Pseudomonas protegens TaxID=380021 RepID=UPI0038089E7A